MPKSEKLLDSKGRPFDRFTDLHYEQERNSLIPEAEKYANEITKALSLSSSPNLKHQYRWNKLFTNKMRELWNNFKK